jgi:uncharacterized iron-regulated protein
MPRTLSTLCLLASLLVGASTSARSARAADVPARKEALEATLRQLEKDIAAVRGLAFKKPVSARIIPRARDADQKLQGYYSTKDKTLYLYDDLAGAYERGVLIHEMVHALQDQHFGLAKLHPTSFDGDADLARAALIEGDATFTMIEVLKKDQPRVVHMLDAPLAKARDLQKAFLYAQGARYVQALRKGGGWEAVNRKYQSPPGSTAAVLHPEGVPTIDLGPGKTRGELALVALFARHPATAAQALETAGGWRGDRLVEQGPDQAWTVAFARPAQALRFGAALAKLRRAENPRLVNFPAGPGASAWRDPRGGVVAVLNRGNRVHVLEARDERAYHALRERVEGPLSLAVYDARQKRKITFGELTDRLLEADLVCVGETHDSDLHHRVQLEIVKALFARDERLGVGMEMFQRPFQKALDRYLAGEVTEDAFLEEAEYQKRWGYDWSLYRPVAEFCRRNGVPLAALNAPRELTQKISKVGVAGLSALEKGQLGPVDFDVKEHRAYWYERLARMHGKAAGPEQKERSYQVMTAWDGYMAASAAEFRQARRLRRLVILAGSGHVDRGFGIPARAAKLAGGKAVTVHIDVGAAPVLMLPPAVPRRAPPQDGGGAGVVPPPADPVADFTVVVQ